jgi:hypothetical protein
MKKLVKGGQTEFGNQSLRDFVASISDSARIRGHCSQQRSPIIRTHKCLYSLAMPQQPRIRVVVQLPYNRPDHPLPDPPHVRIGSQFSRLLTERAWSVQIEWNAEKDNVLWEVIALSRTSDNGGTDCK